MREPKWTRGAYSLPPLLGQDEELRVPVATCNVECWKGTADELFAIAEALQRAVGPLATLSATLTSSTGRSQHGETEPDVQRLIEVLTSDEALVLRVEAAGTDDRRGVLVARRTVPGVAAELCDTDSARALGNAELIYRKMMVGYVDRMGGSRGLLWVTSAFAPILLMSLAFAPTSSAPLWGRIVFAVTAVVASLGTFAFAQAPLTYSNPLVVLTELRNPRQVRHWANFVRQQFARPVVKRTLTVLGALAISAIGSRLARYLPFP